MCTFAVQARYNVFYAIALFAFLTRQYSAGMIDGVDAKSIVKAILTRASEQ